MIFVIYRLYMHLGIPHEDISIIYINYCISLIFTKSTQILMSVPPIMEAVPKYVLIMMVHLSAHVTLVICWMPME